MRLPDFITNALRIRMTALRASRPSNVQIGVVDGWPYMERWFVIPRNRIFNIYLHAYYHDDDRILHSHPWWSVSLMLSGRLREYSTRDASDANRPEAHQIRIINRGDIAVRDTKMFHRLEVGGVDTMTLFFTGPKITTWWFACKRGLMNWKQFESPRRGGAGCGEYDDYPKEH